ncbi:hypothetical protein BKA62DRAFT_656711 [Auriculariales sp. MPI-PUGE-AT-0066]|nr:hypothetical protein BKA62DRAFT_656711 [Auriculariales sp. MPI-PUGE-AT-0066]
MTAAGAPRRELRRTYSYTTATSTSIDRLQLFIAAWKQLPRSNPRRSTGRRLLSLVDPNSDDAVRYREIQPRGVEEARLWGGAPSPASMALLQRELDALAPGTSDMRAALALGEPVSLTLDSFTPHGLGAFPNPVVPFYQIPSDERARRAVVHGSGCMSRNRATRSRPAPPMLVHQFVGQTLWLYWPCTPSNLSRLDNASWTGMVEELEQMHCVVLRPGECIFVPSMSSYITLSLGHEGTNIAAHLKYSLLPGRAYPYAHNPHSHLDLTPRETRAEDTRSHDTSSRPSFEQRIKSLWRRRNKSPEPTPAMPMPDPRSQMMSGGSMGYAPGRR